MLKWPTLLLIGILAAAPGCKSEERGSGLPPADEWNAPVEPGIGSSGVDPGAANPHGAADDPHAGLDMGGSMAGGSMAGGSMAGGSMAGGSMAGGGDIASASGLEAPAPDRAIDASKFLKGTIEVNDKTKSLLQVSHPIFLSVKPYDPATKAAARGATMAVYKLERAQLPARFLLTEADAMSKGTNFAGDVVITAHVSSTGDALTKASGDLIGTARARIPADGIVLVLDTVIP